MNKFFEKIVANRHSTWASDLLLLFIAISIFYVAWLGSHPLMVPDEGRYSDIARAMLVSGDYITPRLNGVTYLDKPILHYWLQALAMKAFGINEWAIRFFPALTGVLGCCMIYAAGRVLFNRRTGFLAAAMLATSPLYFALSHYANLDLEVGVFITASLLAFLVWVEKPHIENKTLLISSAYFFAGLAILTKGLIGIAFPAMIIGAWILALNRWRALLEMRLISGLLIIALVVLPWCVLSQLKDSNFFQHFFIDEQVTRFLTKDFNNQQPIWFYVPVILSGIIPWLIWLFQSIQQIVKSIITNKRSYSAELFLLLWPLFIFIFFTIPQSKTIGYMVPVIPPIILLIARYLDKQWDKSQITRRFFSGSLILICTVEITMAVIAPKLELRSAKNQAMAILELSQPTDEVISYYRYYYDLPVYLNRSISNVERWDQPDVISGDNWRKEISNNLHEPAAHEWLITEKKFWQRWNSDKRVFVIMEKNDLNKFRQGAGHKFYFIREDQDTYLFMNKPIK